MADTSDESCGYSAVDCMVGGRASSVMYFPVWATVPAPPAPTPRAPSDNDGNAADEEYVEVVCAVLQLADKWCVACTDRLLPDVLGANVLLLMRSLRVCGYVAMWRCAMLCFRSGTPWTTHDAQLADTATAFLSTVFSQMFQQRHTVLACLHPELPRVASAAPPDATNGATRPPGDSSSDAHSFAYVPAALRLVCVPVAVACTCSRALGMYGRTRCLAPQLVAWCVCVCARV